VNVNCNDRVHEGIVTGTGNCGNGMDGMVSMAEGYFKRLKHIKNAL
jgi:hypothetical protein